MSKKPKLECLVESNNSPTGFRFNDGRPVGHIKPIGVPLIVVVNTSSSRIAQIEKLSSKRKGANSYSEGKYSDNFSCTGLIYQSAPVQFYKSHVGSSCKD